MPDRDLRFFDSDSHVIESAATLEGYIDASYLDALIALRPPNGTIPGAKPSRAPDQQAYAPNAIAFPRRLGSSDAAPPIGSASRFKGAVPLPDTNTSPSSRMSDMDLDGIDIAMLLP